MEVEEEGQVMGGKVMETKGCEGKGKERGMKL